MRLHVLVALLAVVSAAAGLSAGLLLHVSANTLRGLERSQATEEATLFNGAFNNQIAVLADITSMLAWWDLMYEYMQQRNATGPLWQFYYKDDTTLMTDLGLFGYLFFLPDGTMLNGNMWNVDMNGTAPPSVVLSEQVSAALLQAGESRGLYWIPERETAVIAVSQPVLYSNSTGSSAGWLVFTREVHYPLSDIAQTIDICVSLSYDIDKYASIASAWNGKTIRMKQQITRE
eukprot:m51a1_g4698 hypothetical protein (232) ;mRNA; f:220070-223176